MIDARHASIIDHQKHKEWHTDLYNGGENEKHWAREVDELQGWDKVLGDQIKVNGAHGVLIRDAEDLALGLATTTTTPTNIEQSEEMIDHQKDGIASNKCDQDEKVSSISC